MCFVFITLYYYVSCLDDNLFFNTYKLKRFQSSLKFFDLPILNFKSFETSIFLTIINSNFYNLKYTLVYVLPKQNILIPMFMLFPT